MYLWYLEDREMADVKGTGRRLAKTAEVAGGYKVAPSLPHHQSAA